MTSEAKREGTKCRADNVSSPQNRLIQSSLVALKAKIIDIIKTPVLANAMYRVSAGPMKMPMAFFTEVGSAWPDKLRDTRGIVYLKFNWIRSPVCLFAKAGAARPDTGVIYEDV